MTGYIYIYVYSLSLYPLQQVSSTVSRKINWLQGVASRYSSKLTTTPTKQLPLSSSPWTNPGTDCEDSNEFTKTIWSLDRLSQGRRVRSWAETAVRIHWCYVISSTSNTVTLMKISQKWTFKNMHSQFLINDVSSCILPNQSKRQCWLPNRFNWWSTFCINSSNPRQTSLQP